MPYVAPCSQTVGSVVGTSRFLSFHRTVPPFDSCFEVSLYICPTHLRLSVIYLQAEVFITNVTDRPYMYLIHSLVSRLSVITDYFYIKYVWSSDLTLL